MSDRAMNEKQKRTLSIITLKPGETGQYYVEHHDCNVSVMYALLDHGHIRTGNPDYLREPIKRERLWPTSES